MSELATIPAAEVIQYKTIIGDIERAEKFELSVRFNYADKRQLAEAKSHVFALRKIKGSVERARKEAKQWVLDIGRSIDGGAKTMEARVEALIAPHEAEFEAIERKEAERKAALQIKVDAIAAYGVNRAEAIMQGTITAERLRHGLKNLEAIVVDETFAEMKPSAEVSKITAAAYLATAIVQAEAEEAKREAAKAQAAEIQRLKDEAAESKRISDLAEATRKAKEQAELEAAATIKAQADALAKAEADKVAAANAAELAKAQAKADQAESEAKRLKAENDARIALEEANKQAEIGRLAAIEKAKADQAEAVRLAKVKAEEDRLAAIETERKAEEVRAANKAHVAKIRGEIFNAVHGLTDEAVVDALMSGKIPHTKVQL